MSVYVHIPVGIRPGRVADAITDMQEVNTITKRLAGVTGQMRLVSYGGDALGGARLIWEFESNELLRIFEGFKILKYEELMGAYDWAPGKPLRMIRLVAQKPG